MQVKYGGPSVGIRPMQCNAALGADSSAVGSLWAVASLAGATTGLYHGYKRNKSVLWALGWGLVGGFVPFITIPLSLAQGFGKPK